jgi:acetylornithine deacetylase
LSSSSLTELAAELVRIDSVNPVLVQGGAGEGDLARFVAEWLADAGLEVEVDEVAPGRPNVVGRARGSGGGSTLLLNAHMDTVGYEGMEAPLEPRVENGRLYGRGAYDMKGSLAAIMVAGAEAAQAGLRGDVLVAAVVDEEVFSIGAEAAARRYPADAAIVAEPTELRLVVAHKGFVWMEIETKGRAAHGSRPDLGKDAIVGMGGVRSGLDALELIAAGASAVAIGTILFSDPDAAVRIRAELAAEAAARGLRDPLDARRLAHSSLQMSGSRSDNSREKGLESGRNLLLDRAGQTASIPRS